MYKYIKDDSNFYDLALELSEGNVKEVYCDLETEGLDCRLHKILLFQIMANDEIYIFDFLHLNNEHLKYLVNLLDNVAKVTSVFHNTKFDIKFLAHNTGIWMTHLYDTMNAEVLINAGIGKSTYSLEELALKYAGVQLNKKVREQFFNQEVRIISEQMLQYSAEDVMVLKPIYEQQIDLIRNAREEKILNLEMDLLPVIAKMEYNGVLINQDEWKAIEKVEHDKYDTMDEKLKELFLEQIHVEYYPDAYKLAQAISFPMSNLSKKKETLLRSLTTPDVLEGWFRENFNVNSTYQLQACLRLSGIDTNTTDKKFLKKLDKHPIIDAMLEKSECWKRISQYGLNVIGFIHPVTGRIHTEFLDMGAATGRLSSGSPMNLQNIPTLNGYRECFIAGQGYKWVSVDFNQQEFRLAGAISGERKIIDAYLQGFDMHIAAGGIVYDKPLSEISKPERKTGKGVNFTLIYGGTEYALQKNLGLSEKDAIRTINAYKKGFPTFWSFKEAVEKMVLSQGYSTTLLGRRRYNEPKPTYQSNQEYMKYINKQKREGFNMVVQGTAADVTKIAMLNVARNNPFGEKLKMLIQVHDELDLIAEESIAEDAAHFVKEQMENAERPFLGEIPALADIAPISDHWVH